MSKRKHEQSTNVEKKIAADPLDRAEELLIELLEHSSKTTTHIAKVLAGEISETDADSLPIEFNMKTLELEVLLTTECRKLSDIPTTTAKHNILAALDASLDEQQKSF